MTRSLGISSVILWPSPLVHAVHAFADAGFTRLEVGVDHLLRDTERPCDIAAVSLHTAGRGLTIWSAHLPFGGEYELGSEALHDDELHARYVTLLERARSLGAQVAVMHPTDLHRDQVTVPATLARVRARLERLLGECARLDLRLAVEYMLPHLIGNTQELLWLYDRLPHDRLGFCFDFGHASFTGRLPWTLHALRDRISTTHVHDNRGGGDDHLLPGEGRVDWRQVTAVLDDIGYAGPMILEAGPRELTPEELTEIRQKMEALLLASPHR